MINRVETLMSSGKEKKLGIKYNKNDVLITISVFILLTLGFVISMATSNVAYLLGTGAIGIISLLFMVVFAAWRRIEELL